MQKYLNYINLLQIVVYKQSIQDAIEDEPNRFLKYAIEINPNIKDLGDLRDALRQAFNTPTGHNAISEEALLTLFKTPECQALIKQNTTKQEYEKIYGDGNVVKREIVKGKIVTIVMPKISVKSHIWKGRQIKTYNRGYRKFTSSEIKFLQIRKQTKKLSANQIVAKYNEHFKVNPRTSSSLKTKLYRI
jgi:hypothetical protein